MNSFATEYKVDFFDAVEKIIREYRLLKDMLSQFVNSLSDNNIIKLKKDEKCLSIQLLDIKYDVKEFSEILGYVANVYSTLSTLVKDDSGSLKINKIESGSLFMETYGNGIIIGVISGLLIKIIELVYNKFSKGGKLDNLGKEISTIATSANTIKKLEELGITIDDKTKDKVKECLSYAINELRKVVIKAPKIKVNGEVYSVKNEELYLEYAKKQIDNISKEKDNLN